MKAAMQVNKNQTVSYKHDMLFIYNVDIIQLI